MTFIEEQTKEIVERINHLRDSELEKFLSVYGLTLQNFKEKGYRLEVEYDSLVFGVESWTLYKRQAQKSFSFDVNISI